MGNTKIGYDPSGWQIHYSVGAIIKMDNKYLLEDRAVIPLGFGCPAGHVDEGETFEQALGREIKEETGLTITEATQVGEAMLDVVECVKKVRLHHWRVYECKVKGILKPNNESKSLRWYSKEQLKQLTFEPSWEYWLQKLGIL